MKNSLLNIARVLGFALAIFGVINMSIIAYDNNPLDEGKIGLFVVLTLVGIVLFVSVYVYEALQTKDDSWSPTEEDLAKAIRAHARAELKQKLKDGDKVYVGELYNEQSN